MNDQKAIFKRTSIKIDPEIHKKWKLIATLKEVKMDAFIEEALKEKLEREAKA